MSRLMVGCRRPDGNHPISRGDTIVYMRAERVMRGVHISISQLPSLELVLLPA